MKVTQTQALAQYMPLMKWQPAIGDVVFWYGWFSAWVGVVSAIDNSTLQIIFGGIPSILFTMTPEEQMANARMMPLAKIVTAKTGTFAAMQHDHQHNAIIWYI